MPRFTRLAALIATSCMALSTPVLAQTAQEEQRFSTAQQRFQNEMQIFRTEFDRYQAARNNRSSYRDPRYNDPRYNDPRYNDQRSNDPRYADRDENGYDPARYYRDGPNYQERVLSADDRVYRGTDDRYYCRRNDGTTGLIVGAVGGGVLGNVIDGGRSRAVGTILGGVLGAVAGQAIDRNSQQIRCR
ncbi:MAG: glycine zipper 2TM domain-containing protein [Sphingomonas sp.]|nr:glycine zipper 2TM domain-containing protein [Sphingomonas sp.]